MASKTSCLALTLLLLLPAHALPAAPLPVSGLVTRDTIWSGTVSVVGKVQVLAGCTLTIEPGTRVLFAVPPVRRDADEDRLFVQAGGRLVARGTASQPIEFSSATPGVAWFGVELHSGHDRDVLAHCRLRGARLGLACVATSPLVESCSFEDNQQGVSLWRQARPVLRDCAFRRNGVALAVGMQAAPTVRDCSIEGSGEVGLRVEAGSGGTVEWTTFVGNEVGILKRGSGTFQVTRSRFEANGLAVSVDREGASVEIRDNSFTRNRQGVRVSAKAALLLAGNAFEANETAAHFDGRSRGSVEHNEWKANRVALRLSRTSAPAVSWNAFSGNDTAVLCEYSSYPVIENNDFAGNATALRAGDNQSFEWSRTVWKGDEWEALARSYGRGLIAARGNYWGEETTREMETGSAVIGALFDLGKSPEVTVEGRSYRRDAVDYRPFRTTPVPGTGRPGAQGDWRGGSPASGGALPTRERQ